MRHLILIFCMTIATVLMTATATIALPACPSDPTKRYHNCLGTWIAPTGDKYVGEIKDGQSHGQGVYSFADGRRNVGEYDDGILEGYAIQYRADGSILRKGIFKNGEFQYATKDPNKSDLPACTSSGNFHNCFGTFTYANGSKYVGEFKDGEVHGQGTFTFGTNSKWAGDKYVGEFKDGEIHGPGIYSFADGKRYVGAFKDGALNCYAVQYLADGSIFREGIFKNCEFQRAQN